MAIKHIIVLFVETPREFITAVINLRGVSTNKTIIYRTSSKQTPWTACEKLVHAPCKLQIRGRLFKGGLALNLG
jgi:hypothetical protein